MPTNDEIFEKVQSTLVDALGVDEDDVTPDATLFKDLGAESIDLLDIVFRLELHTVDMLVQYVSSKLSAGVPERALTDGPRCGRRHEVTPATP